jgi:uncharacterized protein (DUF1778 family)
MNMSAHPRDAHNMDAHMNFRLFSHDKALIDAAASLAGLRPQTYARQKLLEIAQKDITEMSLSNSVVLQAEDWQHFIAIMEAPVKINENLKEAVRLFNKQTDTNDTSF